MTLSLSKNSKMAPYVSVLESGNVPVFVEPEAPAGTNVALREKYLIEFKRHINKLEDIPANHGVFIDTVYQSCDEELRREIDESSIYKRALAARPIDIVAGFNLILSMTISEPEQLPALAISCRAYLTQIKMRYPGETVDRFVTRFNDTHEFGVTYLGMIAVPDVDCRNVFLASISRVQPLHEFWVREKTRTDAAPTIVVLQSRLVTWANQLGVNDKLKASPSTVDSSTLASPEISLTAQGSDQYKPQGRKPKKLTGPGDQTPRDQRFARELVGFPKWPPGNAQTHWEGRSNPRATNHSGRRASMRHQRQQYPPNYHADPHLTHSNWDRRVQIDGNSGLYDGMPRGNGYGSRGGDRTKSNAPTKTNIFSTKQDQESCYAAFAMDSDPTIRVGPREESKIEDFSEFVDAQTGEEHLAGLADEWLEQLERADDDSEEPPESPYTVSIDPVSSISLLSKGGPYEKLDRTRTVLDSGSTFHVANDVIPRGLLTGVFRDAGCDFSVLGIHGKSVSLPKYTAGHIVGDTCHLVPKSPMSLISLGMLSEHFSMHSYGDNIVFRAKRGKKHRNPQMVITFVKMDKLFVLMRVTTPSWMWEFDDPMSHTKCTPPPDPSSPGQAQYLSLMTLAVTDGASLDPYVRGHRPETLISGPTSYDHSPLAQPSFFDAASRGDPDPMSIFTKRQRARAMEVKQLKLSLRGISDRQLSSMLQNNRIKGCDLTPKDVETAREIFGNPDRSGKLTEAQQQIQLSPLEHMVPTQVCEIYADVMQLTRTSLFLVAVIMPFNFVMQVPMEATTTKAIQASFVILIGFIRSYNHTPRVVFFDLQSGINPLQGWFLQQGILLTSTNAKTHVHRAERAIRTTKEHLRCVIQSAPVATPKRFLKYLVQSTVRTINFEVDTASSSGNSCPAALFGLPPMVYSNLHPWMCYGEVPAPLSPVSNNVFRSRTNLALCLASHASSNGVHVFLLDTQKHAVRDRFFPLPLTESALVKMKALTANEKAEDIMPSLEPLEINSTADLPDEALEVRGDPSELDDSIPDNLDPPVVEKDPSPEPVKMGRPPFDDARPKNANQSYEAPWVDPKTVEFDLHDDWEKSTGKGRYRYEEVGAEDDPEEPITETHTYVNGARRTSRSRKSPTRLDRSSEVSLFASPELGKSKQESSQTEKERARIAEIEQIIGKDTLRPIMTPAVGTPQFQHVVSRLLNLFLIDKEKFKSDGSHDKWKSRYVLNGNPQSTAGYDAKSLSSPTPSDCIILLFVALAAHLGWCLCVIDVAGAFLNSSLLEGSNIYARIDRKHVPLVLQIRPGWKQYVNDRGEIICKVQKGLYGLRESPLLWSRHLRDTLVNLAGYVQNQKESCVYSRGTGMSMTILIVFVDDILIISKDNTEFERLQEILKGKYGKITTQSGDKLDYLGMEVSKIPGGFEVTQVGSIEKVLDDQEIKGTKPTPSNANLTDVFPDAKPLSESEFNVFRSIVMTLLYVARRTRPDVHFVVAWLTSRMHAATQQDLSKLHHLLKYLNGTRKLGVRLVPRDSSSFLAGMMDSSHGLHLSGHGHWGLCVFFFGMCVLCISRKLKLVCRSSCESEMLGVNEGGVYLLFIRELLSTLGIRFPGPITIYQDNESAIGIMTGDHKIAMSSKHVHLRNLWIMDYVSRGEFIFDHRETKFMTADLLGKALVGHLFRRHRFGVMNWTGLKPDDDSSFMFALDAESVKRVKELTER